MLYRPEIEGLRAFAAVPVILFHADDAPGQRPGLTRIRPDLRLCNQHLTGRCLAQRDGKLLYIDDDHLSQAGARALVQDILKAAK